jgi:hypothetical protein
MDGKEKAEGFMKWWELYGQNFTQAHGICPIKANQ